MIAFRVSVNGTIVTTAGIAGPHVLTTLVTSVAGPAGEGVDRLWLLLGGIKSGGKRKRQLDWLPREQDLKVGDHVLIEIVDVPTVDEPIANQAVKALPRPKPRAGGPRLRVAR